jgi:hypothetical protein
MAYTTGSLHCFSLVFMSTYSDMSAPFEKNGYCWLSPAGQTTKSDRLSYGNVVAFHGPGEVAVEVTAPREVVVEQPELHAGQTILVFEAEFFEIKEVLAKFDTGAAPLSSRLSKCSLSIVHFCTARKQAVLPNFASPLKSATQG